MHMGSVPVAPPPRQGPSVAVLVTLTVVGVLLLGGAGIAVVMLSQSPQSSSAQQPVTTVGSFDEGADESSGGSSGTTPFEETPETVQRTAPPTTSPPDPLEIYADRDLLYDETVAVVWSKVASSSDPGWAQQVEQQIDEFTGRFGGQFVGFRGDDFVSTKGGTVGVAYLGGFGDARSAAVWCRDNGMAEDFACFGLRFSDDFDYETKGPDTRFYPEQL